MYNIQMGRGKKNKINREKHGPDFDAVFSYDPQIISSRIGHSLLATGNHGLAALGFYAGKIHTVVFTKRDRNIRIISQRRSNRKEERAYESAKEKSDTGS